MLEIRAALPGDAEALMELYLRHLTRTPHQDARGTDAWRRMLTDFAADPNYHLLVGTLAGEAVASVTLVVIPNLTHDLRPYALIENVVTHAAHRGQGYAGALMQSACGIAAEAGCYKVMLLTGSKEERTLGFYARCGFNREDKTGFIRWL